MKKQIALIGLWYALALVGTGIATVYGQSSPRISMQGTLTDAAGKSVADGKYNATFRLYTQPVGGTALWQETAEITVDGAIYSHYLGSVQPLDAFFFVNTLYLGIQLDADEITPRTGLTYAPYAFAVNTAKTVVCSGAVGDVKHSILNPVQFAARNGDCWVPMNGAALPPDCKLRQLTGMTNLPDAGGLFIRGQEFSGGENNDPDRTPTSAIATVQSDAFKAHSHPASYDGNHTHSWREYQGYGGNVPDWVSVTDSGHAQNNDQTEYFLNNRIPVAGEHTHDITITGGSETRVKNLNFWVYIRIN